MLPVSLRFISDTTGFLPSTGCFSRAHRTAKGSTNRQTVEKWFVWYPPSVCCGFFWYSSYRFHVSFRAFHSYNSGADCAGSLICLPEYLITRKPGHPSGPVDSHRSASRNAFLRIIYLFFHSPGKVIASGKNAPQWVEFAQPSYGIPWRGNTCVTWVRLLCMCAKRKRKKNARVCVFNLGKYHNSTTDWLICISFICVRFRLNPLRGKITYRALRFIASPCINGTVGEKMSLKGK